MSDENDYIAQQAMINKALEVAAYETKVMKEELNKVCKQNNHNKETY